MTRLVTIVTFAAAVSILTPVVVSATGATQKPAAADKTPQVETTGSIGAARAEQPACARRVKVVYAGYGEGQGASCAVTADVRR
jgi:hypothetical protein